MELDSLTTKLNDYMTKSGKTEEEALNSLYIRFNKNGFSIENKNSLWTKIKLIFCKNQYNFKNNFQKIVENFPKEVKTEAQANALNLLSKRLNTILKHVNSSREEKYSFTLPTFTVLTANTSQNLHKEQKSTIPENKISKPIPKEPEIPSKPSLGTSPGKITEARKTALENELFKQKARQEPAEAPKLTTIHKPKPPKRTHATTREQAQTLLKQTAANADAPTMHDFESKSQEPPAVADQESQTSQEQVSQKMQEQEQELELELKFFQENLAKLEDHAAPGAAWKLFGWEDNPLLHAVLEEIKTQPVTETVHLQVEYLLEAQDSRSEDYNAARRIQAVIFAEKLLKEVDKIKVNHSADTLEVFRSCVNDIVKKRGTMKNLIAQAHTENSELSRLIGVCKTQAKSCLEQGYEPQKLFKVFSELTLPAPGEI